MNLSIQIRRIIVFNKWKKVSKEVSKEEVVKKVTEEPKQPKPEIKTVKFEKITRKEFEELSDNLDIVAKNCQHACDEIDKLNDIVDRISGRMGM